MNLLNPHAKGVSAAAGGSHIRPEGVSCGVIAAGFHVGEVDFDSLSSKNLFHPVPKVLISHDAAYGDEGSIFEGIGREFFIQGFSYMFQNSFGDIFSGVLSGGDVALDFGFGAGEGEGAFDGRPGDVVGVMARQCQFFQFFSAGEVKAQGDADPVDELAGGDVFGVHEGCNFHAFSLPEGGEDIHGASGHVHHVEGLSPEGGVLADGRQGVVFLVAEFVDRYVEGGSKGKGGAFSNKKGGHVRISPPPWKRRYSYSFDILQQGRKFLQNDGKISGVLEYHLGLGESPVSFLNRKHDPFFPCRLPGRVIDSGRRCVAAGIYSKKPCHDYPFVALSRTAFTKR